MVICAWQRAEKPGRFVKLNQHLTKLVASTASTDTETRFARIEALLTKKERLSGVSSSLSKALIEKKNLEERLAATIANITALETEHTGLVQDIASLETRVFHDTTPPTPTPSSTITPPGATATATAAVAAAASASVADASAEPPSLSLHTREQLLARMVTTSDGVIKGARLSDLLEYLYVDPIDHDFIEEFFCTFRAWISVADMLEHLHGRMQTAQRILKSHAAVSTAASSSGGTSTTGADTALIDAMHVSSVSLGSSTSNTALASSGSSSSLTTTPNTSPCSSAGSSSHLPYIFGGPGASGSGASLGGGGSSSSIIGASSGGGGLVGAAKLVLSRSCTLIKHWIDYYWFDFAESEVLTVKLINMIDLLVLDDTAAQVESIRRQLRGCIIEEAAKGRGESCFITSSVTVPAVDTRVLEQADPNEIAKALCIIDYRLMRCISRREFLNSAWTKKDKATLSPNIVALTKRFNEVSRWVASNVLQIQKPRARTKIVERFIQMASRCRELNNYHAVMAILGGLQHPAVQRLQKTWEAVNTRLMDKFAELQNLVSIEDNWSKSRAAIAESKPPCVPYIGLFLKDLIFLEDGMPKYCDEQPELFNVSKQRKIARWILGFAHFQEPPGYTEDIKAEWIGFLSELCFLSEATMDKASNEIEPKPKAKPA